MAIGAGGFLPGVTDIHRMAECQAFAYSGNFQTLSRCALDADVVTQVAVPADGLSFIALVLAVVAAEATAEIEMADIVRIRLPAYLHQGEDVLFKLIQDSCHPFFHERTLACEQVRVI